MALSIERHVRDIDKHQALHQGTRRTFFDYIPDTYSSSKAHSLLIVLHGGGGNGENAMRMANMESMADKEHFILVYPDGAGKTGDRTFTWNSGHCCGHAFESQSDDAGFLNLLLDKYLREYRIDDKRIFIAGFSNGAMMAHRFACEYSDRVAAIATVSGGKNCSCSKVKSPVSVISIHGTDDEHAPYEGGHGPQTKYPRQDEPVAEGIRFWVLQNKCIDQPEIEQKGSAMYAKYTNDQNGVEVLNVQVASHGHAWPGGKPGLKYGNVDDPSQDLNASQIIWNFFKSHPKA